MDEFPDALPPAKPMAGNCMTDKEISLGGDGNRDEVVPGDKAYPEAQPDCAEFV